MKTDNEARCIWAETLINQVEDRSTEIIKWLKQPVEDGLPQALKLMGDLYMSGIGVEKDQSQAFARYKQSAEAGLATGESRLGDCYKYGLGVERNLPLAVEQYSKAVEQDDLDAMQELAEILIEGSDGVEKDEARGVGLLKRAAESGRAKAQWMLGGLFINPSSMEVSCVDQDLAEGVKWMQKSAKQSFGMAECTMAAFYVQGVGVEKDLAKAKEFYTRALDHGGLIKEMEDDAKEVLAKLKEQQEEQSAQKDNDEAKAALARLSKTVAGGDCLYGDVKFGPGVSDLDKEACRRVYNEALTEAPGAEYEMGNVLSMGMYGILVNKKEAFCWYLKSAEHGFADAQYEVARFYSLGVKDVVDCNDEEKFKWYWEAATQGHVESMPRVADCFYYGSGISEDDGEAKTWYVRAAKAGDETSLKMLKEHWKLSDDELQSAYHIVETNPAGMDIKSEEADKDAFRKLFNDAKSGDAAAQFRLGHAFVYGEDGAKMNEHHGVMWLKKAAAQGNADAENLLGDCYNHGWGVEENEPKAAKYYMAAAEKGHGEAAEELGKWYRRGVCVKKDEAEAFRLYLIAAKAGRDKAQFWVGKFYAEGLGGIEKDLGKAVEWYEKSAEQDNTDAICALGWCYQLGNGLEQDFAKAVEWFRKGADNDDGFCMNNLARLIEDGKGVDQDYDEALALFKKAVENDCARANYHIGRFYENGLGVDVDIDTAKEWYQKAADDGDEDAKAALERLG